jgi:hypothetical protein
MNAILSTIVVLGIWGGLAQASFAPFGAHQALPRSSSFELALSRSSDDDFRQTLPLSCNDDFQQALPRETSPDNVIALP